MKKKRVGWILLIVVIVIAVVGFTFKKPETSNEKIILGSQGTDTLVWKHIANSDAAKKAHLDITVKDFTDSNSLNTALANNDIQANAFQSYAFYTNYNKTNSKNKVYALGTSYIQPMGLYSSKTKNLKDIANGSVIAIANDPAAESRGLKLLESAGLIELKKHSVNDLLTPNDITANKKNIKIKTVVSTSTPNLLHDDGVTAVVIDNNTAQMAKLNVFKDSLYHEKLDQNTRANVNVIVTNQKHRNDKDYKKLVELYHDSEIQKWIKKNYPGKMEVNKSLSDLEK